MKSKNVVTITIIVLSFLLILSFSYSLQMKMDNDNLRENVFQCERLNDYDSAEYCNDLMKINNALYCVKDQRVENGEPLCTNANDETTNMLKMGIIQNGKKN